MNKRGYWKILFLTVLMSLVFGMSVFAEEDDLTLVTVTEVETDDELVMASGHGRVSIDGSMLSLNASNNSIVELTFLANSYGNPTDFFEILIYRGTTVVCSKVDNFSPTPGGAKYTYQWDARDVNRYPAGDYKIVATSYYYSDAGRTISDEDSLDITLEDYRLVLDRAFVERLYNKVFGRSADPEGLRFYSERLFNGAVTGSDTIIGFIDSPEFVNKHTSDREYLRVLYQAIFDRDAAESELEYWLDTFDEGVSRHFILKGFVDSPEFERLCASYGINKGTVTLTEPRDLNPRIAGFVNRLYRLTLERVDDGSGINHWVEILRKKQQTPQTVAYGFVFSPEFINRNVSNETFVRIMYKALMDREGEDGGVNYYLDQMAKGLTREKVFSGFSNSPEFKSIISYYGL